MNPRTLAALLGATLLLTGAALWLRRAPDARAAQDAPLFDGLAGDLSQVGRVVVEGRDGRLTLERVGDAWSLAEAGGYPVRTLPVATLARALADARRLERKTRTPARYGELGLAEAGDDPATRATTVRLERVDGTLLADLRVGRSRADSADPGTYVRLPEDPTCWVVSGDLSPPTDRRAWLDTSLLALPAERIAAVRVEHPDGERLDLVRDPEDPTRLDLLEVPAGKELSGAWATARFRSALQYLNLEDVSREPLPEEGATRTTFWTEDGLRVDVTSVERPADGERPAALLARFAVRVDEARPVALVGPLDPNAAPVDLAAEDLPAPDEPTHDPAAVRAEVEQLAARLEGWTFVLPTHHKGTLQARPASLLKDVPEPQEEDTDVDPVEGEGAGPGVPTDVEPDPAEVEEPGADDGGGVEGGVLEDPLPDEGSGHETGDDGLPAPSPEPGGGDR